MATTKKIGVYTVEVEDNGTIRDIHITFDTSVKVKASACVTRSRLDGYLASGKVTRLDIQDGAPVMVSEDFAEPVKATNAGDAQKELTRKWPGAIVQLDSLQKQVGGVKGLHRELFDLLSVDAILSAAQQAQRDAKEEGKQVG